MSGSGLFAVPWLHLLLTCFFVHWEDDLASARSILAPLSPPTDAMRPLYALALLVALAAPAAAQTQTVLFPGQTGAELRASLRAAYRPTSYGSNDNLYANVDRTTVNGVSGVVCVYTGDFVPFDGQPSTDPSQDVFNNGAGINQEHTFPQSQLNGGSSSPAESDLHNLFPTRVDVNADRGNLPFAEIDDAVTSRWYRFATSTTTAPPVGERDTYSELRSSTSFEPREDHEGNVARAMFYVETMYAEDTGDAWFAPQIRTLYAWHHIDPITAADQGRSNRVAVYQNGRDNPFVLDSTLIRRAFFPQIIVADEAGPDLATASLRVLGANPFVGTGRLELRLAEGAPVRAEAFDALGRRVAVLFDGAAPAGALRLDLDGSGLAPGVYAVRVVAGEAVLTQRLFKAR